MKKKLPKETKSIQYSTSSNSLFRENEGNLEIWRQYINRVAKMSQQILRMKA